VKSATHPTNPPSLIALLLLAVFVSLVAMRFQPVQAQTSVSFSFGANPSAGVAPLTVRFRAQATGASSRVDFWWDFGDNSDGSGSDVQHTFYRPGVYNVRFVATLEGRKSDGSLRVTVLDAGPERARIVALADSGLNWSFDASRSVIYAPAARYTWQFSDGSSQEGQVITRRLAPGKQTVVLLVQAGGKQWQTSVVLQAGDLVLSDQWLEQVRVLSNQARAKGWDCAALRFGGSAAGPLARNFALERAARATAVAMALGDFFAHESALDQSSPDERISAAGYRWSNVAENLALGHTSSEMVVDGWLRSPGHCKNLMNPVFTEIGVAAVQASNGRWYWVQEFGKPL
jgi:uncharacterized protein YkwD